MPVAPLFNSQLFHTKKVEIKDVRLPVQLQRAMAKEAEETRNANAKVISSKGEKKASYFFKNAAQTISTVLEIDFHLARCYQ